MQNLPLSAYIHIPFCNSKCNYCAFVSTCNKNLITGYIISLLKDIKTNYKNNPIQTLYIGGGTPSILPLEYVQKIVDVFCLDNPEITFELNPENADYNYLKGLNKIGINRLSIGIQDFNDKILKIIGRKHTSQEAIQTVNVAKSVGFKNISIDLMYGLPTQDVYSFLDSLKTTLELDIQHISLYGLKIEEGTAFYNKRPENLPNDDIQADMYLEAVDILKNFNHYEISNFAIKGFEAKHNLTYWKNKPYYGFGCSAHGYEDNIRYANQFNIKKYIETPLTRDFCHFLTQKEMLEEEIFLGFRLSEGINTAHINEKYEIDFDKKYEKILNKYLKTGHIAETKKGYRLTNIGFLLSTIILAEFI